VSAEPPATITAYSDGPLIVRGDVRIEGSDGQEIDPGRRTARPEQSDDLGTEVTARRRKQQRDPPTGRAARDRARSGGCSLAQRLTKPQPSAQSRPAIAVDHVNVVNRCFPRCAHPAKAGVTT